VSHDYRKGRANIKMLAWPINCFKQVRVSDKMGKVRYLYTYHFRDHKRAEGEEPQCAKGAIAALYAAQRDCDILKVYEIIRDKEGKLKLKEVALEKLLANYSPPNEREFYTD